MRLGSLVAVAGLSLAAARLQAQPSPQSKSASDLAQALLNPATNVINVSFEHNFDFGQGSARTLTYTGNVMPVVPFRLGRTWSLITRTLVPFVSTRSLEGGGDRTLGVGDIVETVYLSRERPASGWFWGAGPTMGFPTPTNTENKLKNIRDTTASIVVTGCPGCRVTIGGNLTEKDRLKVLHPLQLVDKLLSDSSSA